MDKRQLACGAEQVPRISSHDYIIYSDCVISKYRISFLTEADTKLFLYIFIFLLLYYTKPSGFLTQKLLKRTNHLKTGHKFVQFLNVSGILGLGIRIPTVQLFSQ